MRCHHTVQIHFYSHFGNMLLNLLLNKKIINSYSIKPNTRTRCEKFVKHTESPSVVFLSFSFACRVTHIVLIRLFVNHYRLSLFFFKYYFTIICIAPYLKNYPKVLYIDTKKKIQKKNKKNKNKKSPHTTNTI